MSVGTTRPKKHPLVATVVERILARGVERVLRLQVEGGAGDATVEIVLGGL
jgi:hypothetical protein